MFKVMSNQSESFSGPCIAHEMAARGLFVFMQLMSCSRLPREISPSGFGPSGHEQRSLAHVRPHGHLAHVVNSKIVARSRVDKDFPDTRLGETMVRDGTHGLVNVVSSTTSTFTMMMTMRVVMVSVMGRWAVREEINNHKDAPRLEPLDEPFGRQPRVVKVVEAKPHAGHVEIREPGSIPERIGVLVVGHADVSVVSKHLVS